MGAFKAWLDLEEARQLPKSPTGQAIGYALGQWDALTLVLTGQHLPIDSNASERELRVGTHLDSRIDELLPHQWCGPPTNTS